jgi:hypothetical protein
MMLQKNQHFVRAKFLGGLLLCVVTPGCFVATMKPESLWYTSGLIIPLGLLVLWCFLSGRHKASELLQDWQALTVSASILVFAVFLNISLSLSYAISLYFSAFVFFSLTNLFHNILVVLGLYIPPEGELWK